jgi:fatty acid desaturase
MTPTRNVKRELLTKSASTSVLNISKTWVLIFGLLYLYSITHVLFFHALIFIFIGVFQYHLNILGHDGLHYSLSSDKKLNDFLCRWFLHGPCFSPLGMMRNNHIHHHLNLGKPTDTDQQYYLIDRFQNSSHLLRWLSASLFGGMTLPIVMKLLKSKKKKDSQAQGLKTLVLSNLHDLLSVGISQLVLFFIIYRLTGSLFPYFIIWVAPIFTIMMGLNTIRSCLEHALPDKSDTENRMFSFSSNFLERFFLSPYNMNYHASPHGCSLP